MTHPPREKKKAAEADLKLSLERTLPGRKIVRAPAVISGGSVNSGGSVVSDSGGTIMAIFTLKRSA